MNVYALYRTHNHHFAIYGAMFLGQYTPAIQAAQELIDTTPEALLRIPSPPMADFIEGYLPMKQHVLVRFGKWREIIAQELPEDRELYCSTTAMMLYAKAVAHSALGDIAEAEKARAAFVEAKARVPETPARPQQHRRRPARDRRGDAERRARISSRQLRLAFAHLRRSVELDDALPYDEPWGWMQPTRHALGALLLEQGQRRRGGGGLPLGSRLRRQAQPRVPASRECLEPARPPRMPDAPRRHGRGAADQDAARSGAGARGGAGAAPRASAGGRRSPHNASSARGSPGPPRHRRCEDVSGPGGPLGWTAPNGIECQNEVVEGHHRREPSMAMIARIGIDTSKGVFQLHGVDEPRNRWCCASKLRRGQFLAFCRQAGADGDRAWRRAAPRTIGRAGCGSWATRWCCCRRST